MEWKSIETKVFNRKEYIAELLQFYDLETIKSVQTPIESKNGVTSNDELFDDNQNRKLHGSLQYLSKVSRPDIISQ